jgi:hypothetical protein
MNTNSPMGIMKAATRRLLRRKGVESAQDINNGLCDEWAAIVCEAIPQAEILWLDELAPVGIGEWYQHCVVRFNGMLYDSEITEGVETWEQVPYVIRQDTDIAKAELEEVKK